ncbi:MAG TPA: AbrB family transcriptional regulator [Bauldia sp.]|nr:AbrB family transcriptional regulator [Bauldia sp.]
MTHLTDAVRWLSLVATLLVATAGAALAAFAGAPAAWLSGAMVAVTAASFSRLDTRLPVPLVEFSFLLIGIALGAGLTPELLRNLGAWPVSLAALALTVIAVTLGVRWFLFRISGWDRGTAFFSAVPGALSYVIAVAAATEADIRKVAVSQSIRIFLLVAVLPGTIVVLEGGAPAGVPSPVATWRDLAVLVVASTAAGLAFRSLRVPAGLLTGSFAASAFLQGAGLVEGTLPQPAVIAGFVLLGALIGSRFVGTSLAFLAGIILPSVGAFLVATAIASAAAIGVAWAIAVPIDQAIVAFAPGGIDAMMSLALALHMDTAFVAAHQFARFAGIAFGLPFFLRWARGRGQDG